MIENRQVLINIHSDDLVQGQPKLPTASQLEYGEIAVSYAKSAETLSIRNSEDEIVTFSCDDKFNESFRVMSKAMCDLDDRVLALEELSAITIGDLVKTDAELGNVTTSGKVVDALLVKDINNQVDNIETSAGTFNTRITNLETSAGTFDTRLDGLETSAGTFNTRITNIETSAGTLDTRLSNLEASAITIDDIINTEEAFSALTASGKVVDAKLIRDIIYDNEETTASALNNLNDKIIELSGATPSLETTLAVSGDSAITVTIGDKTSNALTVPYAVSASTVTNTVTTEAELSALTQTGSYVDAKLIRDIIYDNEDVTSQALNNLNDKIIELSGATPDFDSITNKPTTISGYGITDAFISGSSVTLGENTIGTDENPIGYATNSVKSKTELKTDEEFVFRNTNVDWDASSAYLKKIKGNSVAWNQAVLNGDFHDGSNNFVADGCAVTMQNNYAHCEINTSYAARPQPKFSTSVNAIQGHKYYLSVEGRAQLSSGNLVFCFIYGDYYNSYPKSLSQEWKKFAIIGTDTKHNQPTDKVVLYISEAASSFTSGDYLDIRNCFCVDLTLLYGSTISGMTDAQILEKFESDFPGGYYPYNEGTIINNAVDKVETVGFNLWDGEVLKNSYVNPSGDVVTTPNYDSSKNFVSVTPSTSYHYYANNYSGIVMISYFDANKKFIIQGAIGNRSSFSTPDNCHYILFHSQFQVHYPDNVEICINLSDPERNGQYEPYWRNATHTNLTNLMVKSPNIWDEQLEFGYGYSESTGDIVSNANLARNITPIEVRPGDTMYFHCNNSSLVNMRVFYYNDSTYVSTTPPNNNSAFTIPSGITKMNLQIWVPSYGTTYNHDICINISNASFNGKYFPHGSFNPFPEGLRSAGNACDEIIGNKAIRRVGSVLLKNRSWTKSTSYSYGFYSSFVTDYKAITSQDVINYISANHYPATANDVINSDNTSNKIAMDKNSAILVCSDAANTSGFIGSLSDDDEIYYELANEEVFEIENLPILLMKVDKGGTEEIEPKTDSQGNPASAPIRADIQYGTDMGDIVESFGNSVTSSIENIDSEMNNLSETIMDLQSQIGDIETILQSINGN